MRVAFLYNEASEDPAGQSDDDLEYSPNVAALERDGHTVKRIVCTLDLASVRRQIEIFAPDVVFNRVDSLGGSDAMMAAVTMLLDAMRLPYTGCPTAAIVAATSKVAVKERLVSAGLPTPDWISADGVQPANLKPRFIVKSIYEHASYRIEDTSVIGPMSIEGIAALLRQHAEETGRPFFAEEYIDGREFNLALWGNQPEMLPPAEIDFSNFPTGKPRIVGQRAKWDVDSFEYDQTERRFEFAAADRPLLQRLQELAIECWRLFGLRGYSRIDFRVDAAGQPWILEVNTNPCLSPEAGFAAAWERAGIAYDAGIGRILQLATEDTDQHVPLRVGGQQHPVSRAR